MNNDDYKIMAEFELASSICTWFGPVKNISVLVIHEWCFFYMLKLLSLWDVYCKKCNAFKYPRIMLGFAHAISYFENHLTCDFAYSKELLMHRFWCH